jgi:KaiC/GvpD/RAD55 family RecA-like ATPase
MVTEEGFVKMYVKGLDERIEGGIPGGSIVLTCGMPGTLKTTFCFNILFNHAKETGQRGLYVSLEQHRDSIISQMKKLGLDPTLLGDKITIMDLAHLREMLRESAGSDEQTDWLQTLVGQIKHAASEGNKVMALDSLDAVYALAPMDNVRNKLFFFFEALRSMGMTSFLITEMQPGSKAYGKFGVEGFLGDGIIHLEMEKVGKSVGRFISVVKLRGSNHPTDYFPLLVDKTGFKVVLR